MGSPLWKRGVRGDFIEILDSIGVIHIVILFNQFQRFPWILKLVCYIYGDKGMPH